MKSLRKSLPNWRTTLLTVAVCLGAGVASNGFHPMALFGLPLAAVMIVIFTLRNHDPESYEARSNPLAYALRADRDRLLVSLRALTETVEAGAFAEATAKATESRRLLNELTTKKQ